MFCEHTIQFVIGSAVLALDRKMTVAPRKFVGLVDQLRSTNQLRNASFYEQSIKYVNVQQQAQIATGPRVKGKLRAKLYFCQRPTRLVLKPMWWR